MIDYNEKLNLDKISDEVIVELAKFYGEDNTDKIKKRLTNIKGYVYISINDINNYVENVLDITITRYILLFLKMINFTVNIEQFEIDLHNNCQSYFGDRDFYQKYVYPKDKAQKLMYAIINYPSKIPNNILNLFNNIKNKIEEDTAYLKEDKKTISKYIKTNNRIYNKFNNRVYKYIYKNYPDHPIINLINIEYTKKKYQNEKTFDKIDPNHIVELILDTFSLESFLTKEEKNKKILEYLNLVYNLNLKTFNEFLKNKEYLKYLPTSSMIEDIEKNTFMNVTKYHLQSFYADPCIKNFKELILNEAKKTSYKEMRIMIKKLFLAENIPGFSGILDNKICYFINPLKAINPSLISLHEFMHAIESSYYITANGKLNFKTGLDINQYNSKINRAHYDVLNEVIHQLATEEFYNLLLNKNINLFGNMIYKNRDDFKIKYKSYYCLLEPLYQSYKKEINYAKFHEINELPTLFNKIGFVNYYEFNDLINSCYKENSLYFNQMSKMNQTKYILQSKKYINKMKNYQKNNNR